MMAISLQLHLLTTRVQLLSLSVRSELALICGFSLGLSSLFVLIVICTKFLYKFCRQLLLLMMHFHLLPLSISCPLFCTFLSATKFSVVFIASLVRSWLVRRIALASEHHREAKRRVT